tara:strand:- start:2450 stop:3244 length:795 start_codon:yes stop_codon:yes gene_type:complete
MPADRNQHWTTWIKWLPIELRLTIYDFVDIETRMQILTPLFADTIQYLYRSKQTKLLLHKYEQLVYMQLFTKVDNDYSVKPKFIQILPPIIFLKAEQQCVHIHPILNLLKGDLRFSSFYKRMIMAVDEHRLYRYHPDVVNKIQQCFNLIPTITSFNAEFDYQIKRLLIRFLHHLTKIVEPIKEDDRQRIILAYERKIRRYYSKRVLPRIKAQSNKMQRTILKKAKFTEKNIKLAEKQHTKLKKGISQNAKKAAKQAIKMLKIKL